MPRERRRRAAASQEAHATAEQMKLIDAFTEAVKELMMASRALLEAVDEGASTMPRAVEDLREATVKVEAILGGEKST